MEVVWLWEDVNVDVVDCVEYEVLVEVEEVEESSDSVVVLMLFVVAVILVGCFLSIRRRQI